ncbi:GNAT family N-acetyltransferase [Pseudobacter ginsenosidimutans]|uniref:ElaA protein n=1 Tax=Pseudobacter ginsenosidimutans TaxID=661488 RepID=A0A4Q7MMS0_9BACT|nr:GNAT family N-acetyltransferase [Pseudobacter ginsenosidimutans]QEC40420.1 GNAT family N-acetyltransferase [Pseudobacter ginsenosidimutans]RZS68973.1 ElaA protein [Pseudobacter ginsenosidimutans]
MSSTTWSVKPFAALTPAELYAILRLRSEVFVVEQQCVFLDMDNKDQQCLHLMGWQGELLAASTRLVPPGISYELPSIGRVVSSPLVRGTGIGRELMQRSIDEVKLRWGTYDIKIGAQLYLMQFYNSLGFEQSSAIYMEDNIEHIEMIRYNSR